MFQAALFGFVTPALRQLMKDKGTEAWPKVKAILSS